MDLTVSREEIKEYQKLKIISQLAPIRERIKFFERKYGCSFEDFEKSISEGEESFEKWDDYIQWKAYSESLRDLTAKLEKIEDAKNIRITQILYDGQKIRIIGLRKRRKIPYLRGYF